MLYRISSLERAMTGMMVMIQCDAYYMPKDIYHLIFPSNAITPLSSTLIKLHHTLLDLCPLKCDYHMLFMAFRLNSTPTKVAAYLSALEQQMKVYKLTLAGKALAMAGPNPFQSAVTPSAAINFRAQSRKPEYVP